MNIFICELWHDNDFGIFSTLLEAISCVANYFNEDFTHGASTISERKLHGYEFVEINRWDYCQACRAWKSNCNNVVYKGREGTTYPRCEECEELVTS